MNKEELIKNLKDLGNSYPDNVSYNGVRQGLLIAIGAIDQLDEPRKVIIPRFVADRIMFSKDDASPRNSMGEARNSKELNVWLAKTEDYMTYPNQEKFMRAWLDGYEIEKEKLYKVCFMDCIEYTVYERDEDGKIIEDGMSSRGDELTEAEIAAIDPRFWPFAVEVAE